MLLLFDYSGPRERYLSSFRLTFLVRTTTMKGNVERTTSATAAAPRKYHKVCFYTASATAAIQLDFLCAAAVIIRIIYRPKTHHNIINHITSLPVNIIYTCVCVRLCAEWHRPKAFSVRRGGKSWSETIFFFS